jgi:DNA (cytosine-5)-methyltransferase 1
MSKSKFTFIDLFAGIGGMRIAFEKAGGECLQTCEIDDVALKTYKVNYHPKDTHSYVGDISKLKNKDVPIHDILLAGFPCQPYSIAGLRKGLADDRGKVFNDIIRIIKGKKPKVFLLENVKGITTHDNGNTFKYIVYRLEKIGYHIRSETLNTMEHANIPQNRERVFIIGFLDKEKADKFVFPKKIKLSTKFTNLLENRVGVKYYYDKRYDCYSILKKEMINKNSVYQWRRHYVRENKSGVCPTLTANMGSGGHNVPLVIVGKKIRKLTPRECARLQGFPDTFILPKIGDSNLYHQLGNSVTIPLIHKIAVNIIKVL